MDENGGNDQDNEDSPPVLSVDFDTVKSYKGEDGLNYFTDKHKEQLDLWTSDDPTKAKFKTSDGKLHVPRLARSYLELQSKVTKLSQPLPKDATEQERFEHRKAVARATNVPDTPQDYNLIVPEGVNINKESMNEFLMNAHKLNMSRESAQFALDNQIKASNRIQEATANALKTQNEEAEHRLKTDMGPDDFATNDQLLQRYLRNKVESDEEFDELFDAIQQTLFPGGAKTKIVLMKALCEAARIAEGEGKSIYTQYQEKLTAQQSLKEEFPESYKDLED